jgi:uncharacterized protein (DUF111 family)
MAKVLYIDPFGGAAGDMLLGALLDLGVSRDRLDAVLAGLRLEGWRLEAAPGRARSCTSPRIRSRRGTFTTWRSCSRAPSCPNASE